MFFDLITLFHIYKCDISELFGYMIDRYRMCGKVWLVMSEKWNGEEMVDVTGKTIVITGANSGIGFETAFMLASIKGAEIILAVRNASKGEKAVEKIPPSTLRRTYE